MPDFIFIRMFYVIFKIVEAFVLAIPVILIQLFKCPSSTLSPHDDSALSNRPSRIFYPSDAGSDFRSFKSHVWRSSFPAITSLLTLLIFYIEKLLENLVTSGFDKVLKTLPSLYSSALSLNS